RRSMQPDVDQLIERPQPVEELETGWGLAEGRVAGVPYGWFVLVGLLLAGTIGWAVHAARKGEVKVDEIARQAQVTVEEEAESEAVATLLVNRVEEVLRAYLAAETVGDLLPLVRDPERVKPLIEDWLGRN